MILRSKRRSIIAAETGGRRWTMSMQCSPFPTVCWPEAALPALESVGLDAYVGFLHRDRPGRTSLALDLMEELRPCMADRFVLTLINNQVMRAEDFETAENGAVLMTDMGRRKFLKSWQERKQEMITHPYLGEKLPWGLVPYMQALLLARYLRRDLDAYPPFLWK